MTAGSGAVLVVDDDKMNRILLSKLLENEGYRPTAVVDGAEALEAVAEEPFDAVLLDVMMPGVDGIEVLRTLKSDSRWRHIPVIMISALDDTASIARCLELGAEDYLLRPFDPVLVRSRVNGALAGRRLEEIQEEHHAVVREQREEGPLAPHRADVAVVAIALSGTSALAAEADPAATIRRLNEFHAVLAGLVQETDATVVSAGADTLTVVFGDPVPSPDGPGRAQRFATRAGEALTPLLAESRAAGPELTLGIGTANGWATLGQVGPDRRCDYVAVGAVVDEAQRRARAGG